MSSTGSGAPTHLTYKKVTAKNAKCDICNTRNLGVMQKCVTCGVTTCENCKAVGRYDSKHNLASLNLDWTQPNPNGKGVRSSVLDDHIVPLVVSSDDEDDDSLFVHQTPRAPRAPGTSRRKGLIRERATMAAACNLRRAVLGDSPGSHPTAQSQNQGHSFAHRPQAKSGPIVLSDGDDLMEIPAPSSLGQLTGSIRKAEANITRHLRDENKALAGEVRRLREKECSHADEDYRLREQLKQQASLAEEARVTYHRAVASHKKTVGELSDIHQEYDGLKVHMTKHDTTALALLSGTARPEDPRPAPPSVTSSAPATDAAGSSASAGAGSICFGDLPAVREARRNQFNAGSSFEDGVASAPLTRIPRNPFQAEGRKRRHTGSDPDFLNPAAAAPSIEDKDIPMKDASSSNAISPDSAIAPKKTPAMTTSQDSAGARKVVTSTAISQTSTSTRTSTMKSAGTQTRLSAASCVGLSPRIAKDLDATVLKAVFGRDHARAARLKMSSEPGRHGGVDNQVLFGVKRKWERSVGFREVKAAEGPLPALQMLETATTLGCLSRGIAFPPKVDAYIQGVREAHLRAHRGETDAVAD